MMFAGRLYRSGLITLTILGLLFMGCSTGGSAANRGGADALARLAKVDVVDTGEFTTVELTVDRPVTFTSVRVTDPPGMVLDLAGVDISGFDPAPMSFDNPPVTDVKVSSVPNAARVARLEIGLMTPATSKIAQKDGVISIIFDKKGVEAAAKPVVAPPSAAEEIREASVVAGEDRHAAAPEAPMPAADTAKAAPKAQAAVAQAPVAQAPAAKSEANLPAAKNLESITFKSEGAGYLVSLECDGAFESPKVFTVGGDRVVVDMFKISSEDSKQTIDVGGSCLKRIRMATHDEPDGKVRVVLDVNGNVEHAVMRDGSRFIVAVVPEGKGGAQKLFARTDVKEAPASPAAEAKPPVKDSGVKTAMTTGRKISVSVDKSDKPAAALASAVAAAPEAVAVPASIKSAEKPVDIYISEKDGNAILSSAPIEDGSPEGMKKADRKSKDYVVTETRVFTGGKISFDIQNANLDQVIKLLADVAGLNLIMDPADVRGSVTLKLDGVPWDQALDILLKIYKLDKVIEGNVLRVAPKARLDEEKRRDLLQIAEQKKLVQQAEDLYTKTFKINYMTASELEGQVKKILSPRGDATANPRTNELIVTDIQDNIERAGELIGILDKEVKQIMIEARIITVDVGYTQSLGLSWGISRDYADGHTPKAGLSSGTQSSLTTEEDGSFILTVPSELGALGTAGLAGGLSWFGIDDSINLDLTISALETIGKGETLAAPKVLVLENQSASITQGTTLYVQTTSAAGTRPEPLNANLSLTVEPRVTGDDFIMMNITATNNEPSTNVPPGSTAAIDTQSVTTNIIVKDGDTIVLGGIYTKSKSNNTSGVPLLSRIPILGWLFKERTINEPTSELLIFITPKLIKSDTHQV